MGDNRNGTDPRIPLLSLATSRLSLPPPKARWALLKTAHFWLWLLANVAAQVATWQLPDTTHRLILLVVQGFAVMGYGGSAFWNPPREPWTDEQRAQANKEK